MDKSTRIILKTLGLSQVALDNIEKAAKQCEGPEVVAAVSRIVDVAVKLPDILANAAQQAADTRLQLDRIETKLDVLLGERVSPPMLSHEGTRQ